MLFVTIYPSSLKIISLIILMRKDADTLPWRLAAERVKSPPDGFSTLITSAP